VRWITLLRPPVFARELRRAESVADVKRTSYLESRGYRVLRFWNNEVTENLEGVLSVLLAEIEKART
jgi:very-short-patch-repair endonuclease